jgi:hypothetical protein
MQKVENEEGRKAGEFKILLIPGFLPSLFSVFLDLLQSAE